MWMMLLHLHVNLNAAAAAAAAAADDDDDDDDDDDCLPRSIQKLRIFLVNTCDLIGCVSYIRV